MLDAVLRRLIPDAENVRSPAVRAAYGKLAGWVGILCNVLLFAGKLTIGLVSGSLSIAADAVNNLSDAASSVISLLGFKMGAKPADAGHPYGHGRYEYLAGLSVAVLIMVIGVELLKSSFEKVLHPAPVQFSAALVAVLLASIALKGWMMRFNRHIGKKIGSETLIATAADSRNDVVTTACVLAGAVLARLTGAALDGWFGLGVAAFILYSGFGLVKSTLDPLLGRAPDETEVNEIRARILAYPGVVGTHDLIIHDYGPGRQFASVHVEMSADDDPLKSHAVVDTIEREFLRERGINLVVHMDPVADENTAMGKLNEWLLAQVQTIDPALTVHDLCMLPRTAESRPVLEFDCVAPRGLSMENEDLKRAITLLVNRRYPHYDCNITVDRDYAGIPGQDD